jgi:hypothetical protein
MSGAEEDEDWLENSRARCEHEGFGFVDRVGTWETSSSCPEADYFAACLGDEREEYFLLSDTDRNLDERQELCEDSGGTWEWYENVEPKAYYSVADAVVVPVVTPMHPDVLVDISSHQFCSGGAPEGTVGISESYNGATDLARYYTFVCIDGTSIQSTDHFTQSSSERYTLADDVPGATVSVGILLLRDQKYYIFTDRGPNTHCLGCGESMSYSPGDTNLEVTVIDNAGDELLLDLTLVEP